MTCSDGALIMSEAMTDVHGTAARSAPSSTRSARRSARRPGTSPARATPNTAAIVVITSVSVDTSEMATAELPPGNDADT